MQKFEIFTEMPTVDEVCNLICKISSLFSNAPIFFERCDLDAEFKECLSYCDSFEMDYDPPSFKRENWPKMEMVYDVKIIESIPDFIGVHRFNYSVAWLIAFLNGCNRSFVVVGGASEEYLKNLDFLRFLDYSVNDNSEMWIDDFNSVGDLNALIDGVEGVEIILSGCFPGLIGTAFYFAKNINVANEVKGEMKSEPMQGSLFYN